MSEVVKWNLSAAGLFSLSEDLFSVFNSILFISSDKLLSMLSTLKLNLKLLSEEEEKTDFLTNFDFLLGEAGDNLILIAESN